LNAPPSLGGTPHLVQTGENLVEDKRMITGMFPDRDSAESAYNGLIQRGYSKDDVDLVMDRRSLHRSARLALDGTIRLVTAQAAIGAAHVGG
jgi:hypothetical protein